MSHEQPALSQSPDEASAPDVVTSGMVEAAAARLGAALHRYRTVCNGGGTMWNGEAGDLLNLPLATQVLEQLDAGQIGAWGTEGNVRKLIGVLNADPGLVPGLPDLQDAALALLLSRGAKSLDALLVSVSLSHSQPIIDRLYRLLQAEAPQHQRAGAMAALQMLAKERGLFGEMIGERLRELREGGKALADYAVLRPLAAERLAATLTVRVDTTLATYERDMAMLLANEESLDDLIETVTRGLDDAEERIEYVPAIVEGFRDILQAYDTQLSTFNAGLQAIRRMSASADAALQAGIERLAAFRQAMLLDRVSIITNEGRAAIACADPANFRGLPPQTGSKGRYMLLAQAKDDLAATIEVLKDELVGITATIAELPDGTDGRRAWQERLVLVTTARENLKAMGKRVLQAISSS